MNNNTINYLVAKAKSAFKLGNYELARECFIDLPERQKKQLIKWPPAKGFEWRKYHITFEGKKIPLEDLENGYLKNIIKSKLKHKQHIPPMYFWEWVRRGFDLSQFNFEI